MHMTDRSATHVAIVGVVIIIGGAVPPVSQQYSVALPWGVPWLQTSDELTCVGVSLPVQEKPMEDPVQPWTLPSCMQVPVDGV
jgi:hypothetical protein